MVTSYALYKLVHLVAIILFLGNATLGLFWVAHAERTRDPAFIGHAMQGIIRADRWFTTPGVILITAAGIAAAMAGGYRILAVGWIAGSIAMFILSGLVFGFALAPLQRRIVDAARTATHIDGLAAPLRRWHAIGWLAVTPLWLAVAMMVLKWPG